MTTEDHKTGVDAERERDDRSLRDAIRYVTELHGSIRRPFALIVVTGAVAGVVEAVALIAFVRALVEITSGPVASGGTVAGVGLDSSPGVLISVAVVLAVVAAVLHIVLARSSANLGERVAMSSRQRLIEGFLEAQWAYAARYREGRLQEAVSSLSNSASRATAHLALGISSLVIIAVLGVAAFAANPLVAASLLTIPAFLFLVARPFIARLRSRWQTNIGGAMGLASATAATANLALEFRTTGTQRQQADRLLALVDAHSAGVARSRSAGFAITFLFKDSALIVLISVVGVLYLVTDLRSASLTASVLVVIRMLGYLQQAFRLLQDGAEDLASISVLQDTCSELEAHRETVGSVRVDEIRSIRFADVHYSYDGDRAALRGVSLDIEPNTTVGLVGPSGAGKSTTAEMLLGLRSPTNGHLIVNGVDLAEVSRNDWTRLTAIVPQHQQLADVSIAQNIRFLRKWISDDEIVEAAVRAHIHDEILDLPGGYDHLIGSRSQGLSGGQRQRIAIARALVGRPQLLVLDEPTSALDAVTEQLVRQTLDELHGQVTIVVIAHRPAALEACDTVVHLDAGRVARVEDGPRRLRPPVVTRPETA